MKRTCDGCRASLQMSMLAGGTYYCVLGYKVETKYIKVPVGGIPLEQCPKPTTWKQYGKASHKSVDT